MHLFLCQLEACIFFIILLLYEQHMVVYEVFFSTRHVILPKDLAEFVPKTHLMTESEWRNLGVQQSPGWIHYLIHEPGKYFPSCHDNSVFLSKQNQVRNTSLEKN